MKKIFFQRTAVALGLAAIASVGNGMSAGAQTLAQEGTSEAIATQQSPKNQPIPGTANTSAVELSERAATTAKLDDGAVSQAEVDPGRRTRSGSSYLGVGGNIGIGGDTGIGDFGFAIFSKIGLTERFAVRPAVVFSGDTDILLPLTYEFPVQAEPFERLSFAPYVGAGLIITTSDDSNLGALLTGGVDVPISDRFTATAGLNIGFNSDTVGVGLIIGVGYNFSEGFRF